jgi:DNA-binding NarL/FixJ family response regulator
VALVLVDDQRLVREGLRELIARQAEMAVVGEAATAAMALAECHRVRPDVLLVDALLPERAAFSLIRQVRRRYPEIGVIALAECDPLHCVMRAPGSPVPARCGLATNGENGRQHCVETALQAGAHRVVRKTQSPEEFLEVIVATAGGERGRAAKTPAPPLGPRQDTPPVPDPGLSEGLSRREVEVIRGILAGHSNKEIARTQGLREQTVKNTVSRVLHKLHLHDRVQIALHALETRLLERYAAFLL